MKKRALSAALSLCLLLTLLPTAALAVEEEGNTPESGSSETTDKISITEFGYADTAAQGNEALGVTDCADKTMWIKLDKAANTGNYWGELVAPGDGNTVAPWFVSELNGSINSTLFYWSFQNSEQNTNNLSVQAGTYTFNIYSYTGTTSSPEERPENMELVDSKTITLYSTQDTVNAWGEYIAVLGQVTVPGSELKYSGVPAIYAAMTKGYSDLWALGDYTTAPQTEALDALKANLLNTVREYNLYLLNTAYGEGNGYVVGETTYVMPERAYNTAKAAIESAADLNTILTAYQTAIDSQYIKDAVGIASVGFQADAEAANNAINKIIEGLDGTAGSVKDCDANTMYIALTQRTAADDNQGYDVKVTNEAGETVYSEAIAENEAAGVIYFTFDANGGSHAEKALASGTYTVSLLKSGWSDPINTMTISLGSGQL